MNPSLSDYRQFLAGVKNRVLDARIQAGRAINRELVFYLRAIAQFGWTRNILVSQVKTGACGRTLTEKKSHNLGTSLPEHLTEQADEMLKSRYHLEFLGLKRGMKERELGERLQQFILELGYGFCFVGWQYRLALGKKKYFVDLLFYHRFLKVLMAFGLKVGAFETKRAGKMDFGVGKISFTPPFQGMQPGRL